jgi:hypothetical protein
VMASIRPVSRDSGRAALRVTDRLSTTTAA